MDKNKLGIELEEHSKDCDICKYYKKKKLKKNEKENKQNKI